jgi:hypothetical protein
VQSENGDLSRLEHGLSREILLRRHPQLPCKSLIQNHKLSYFGNCATGFARFAHAPCRKVEARRPAE